MSTTATTAPPADVVVAGPLHRLRTFGRRPRLMGVDIARGLAVLGMVGAHVGVPADLVWDDPRTWSGLAEGRPAILFAVLAGISMALLTGGRSPIQGIDLQAARVRFVARGAVVFTVGVALELLSTGVAVILPVYGILFVLALPALGWSIRRLLATALGLALLGPLVLAAVATAAPDASGSALSLVLLGSYPVTVWLALMLTGLALGRLPLHRARTAAALLAAGVAVSALGYGLGALASPATSAEPSSVSTSGGSEVPMDLPGSQVDLSDKDCSVYADGSVVCFPASTEDDEPRTYVPPTPLQRFSDYLHGLADSGAGQTVLDRTVAVEPHSGGIPEVLGSGGLAVAVLGACLLIARPLRWLLIPLAAVGAMPLTAYTAHVVAIWVLVGSAGSETDNGLWLWMSAGLLVACTAWALVLGRGPLERLTARLSARATPSDQPRA